MGKVVIVFALGALLATSAAQVGGMWPLALLLLGLVGYALVARQRSQLNADPEEAREARARVAASAVPCDWVRPE